MKNNRFIMIGLAIILIIIAIYFVFAKEYFAAFLCACGAVFSIFEKKFRKKQ